MIISYVCTRCNHNFQDKLVGTKGQTRSDLGRQSTAAVTLSRIDGTVFLLVGLPVSVHQSSLMGPTLNGSLNGVASSSVF
jgi:transposase-like protein